MSHPLLPGVRYDLDRGTLEGGQMVTRKLSDLRGAFADPAAFDAALAEADPVAYTVSSLEPGGADGDLHYGLGVLMPGKVGDEYFLTKGHYHEWRDAAEVYLGLRGEGLMLLEDEATGETRALTLGAGAIVYVPGRTAHRTVNTGAESLVYIGVYPAKAGHDYGSLAKRNFLKVVVERDGKPAILDRAAL